MRDWEAQLRHGEKAYNYQNLTKNLPLKEPGGVEGTVAPSPAVLSPDQARVFAEKLLLLYTEITRLEERHYRSIPLRDL